MVWVEDDYRRASVLGGFEVSYKAKIKLPVSRPFSNNILSLKSWKGYLHSKQMMSSEREDLRFCFSYSPAKPPRKPMYKYIKC